MEATFPTYTEIAITQARHCERLDNLEGWQKAQNGSLVRLEKKVDDGINGLKKMLIGMLVSVSVASILLAVNLAVMTIK